MKVKSKGVRSQGQNTRADELIEGLAISARDKKDHESR